MSTASEATARDMSDNTSYGETFEIRSTADSQWVPVKVIDTDKMKWDEEQKWLWQRKVLYSHKDNGSELMLLYIPPGWEGGLNHYHLFHEWAYIMQGDLTNNDYASPDQKLGYLMQFREGHWLDRPPYSLHGGELGRLMSQIGSFLIIQKEGSKTVDMTGDSRRGAGNGADVKNWAMPRIVDTIGDTLWEDEGNVDGLKIKRLADDPGRGFRANLFWLPAGWRSEQAPDFARPYHFRQARQFNFVLAGELTIQAYQNPETKAEQIKLGRYFYFEREPMCICGLPDGLVTEQGCVWLQVTYGNGADVVVSDMPIEDPVLS